MSFVTLVFVLLTPFWATLAHAVLARTPFGRKLPGQRLAVLCCVGTVVGVTYLSFAFEFFFTESQNLGALFFGITSALLAHLYFHIFNMSETARRVRILVDVSEGKEPSETTYSDQQMISVRIDRLYDLNQVRVWSGKYFSKPTFLRFVSHCIQAYEYLIFPRRSQPSFSKR